MWLSTSRRCHFWFTHSIPRQQNWLRIYFSTQVCGMVCTAKMTAWRLSTENVLLDRIITFVHALNCYKTSIEKTHQQISQWVDPNFTCIQTVLTSAWKRIIIQLQQNQPFLKGYCRYSLSNRFYIRSYSGRDTKTSIEADYSHLLSKAFQICLREALFRLMINTMGRNWRESLLRKNWGQKSYYYRHAFYSIVHRPQNRTI